MEKIYILGRWVDLVGDDIFIIEKAFLKKRNAFNHVKSLGKEMVTPAEMKKSFRDITGKYHIREMNIEDFKCM